MNQPEKNFSNIDRNRFLYPIKTYQGLFTPEKLVFNANLQEFAQRVSYIVGLHTNGKLSSKEAYQKLDNLWLQVQKSKESMKIDEFE